MARSMTNINSDPLTKIVKHPFYLCRTNKDYW